MKEVFLMKRMNKMLAIITAATLTFSLAACGNSASTSGNQTDTNTSAKQTETMDNSENTSKNEEGNIPGDSLGEPSESGFNGTPPEGGPGGTPPDGNPPVKPDGEPGGGFGGGTPPGGGTADFDYTAATEITEAAEQADQTYASETVDESALIVNTADAVSSVPSSAVRNTSTIVSDSRRSR